LSYVLYLNNLSVCRRYTRAKSASCTTGS